MKKFITAALLSLSLFATSAFAGVVVSNNDLVITAPDEYVVDGKVVIPVGTAPVTVTAQYVGNLSDVFVYMRAANGSVQCSDIVSLGGVTSCIITNSNALYGTWDFQVLDFPVGNLVSSTLFVVSDGLLPPTSDESVTEAVVVLEDAILVGEVVVKTGFLNAVLDNALNQIEKGNTIPALKMLEALLAEINDQLVDGTIDPAAAADLIALIENAIALL